MVKGVFIEEPGDAKKVFILGVTRAEAERAIRDYRDVAARIKAAELKRNAALEALEVYKRRGDVFTLLGMPVDQAIDLLMLTIRMLELLQQQRDNAQELIREAKEIQQRYAPKEGGTTP